MTGRAGRDGRDLERLHRRRGGVQGGGGRHGRAHGGFDLAAIPIGVYEPRWFMKRAHVDPDEALQVFRRVNAKRAIGIHWGTYDGLSDESLDEPPAALQRARQQAGIAPETFMLFALGETRSFSASEKQPNPAQTARPRNHR